MEKGGKLIRLDDHYVPVAIDSLDSFNDVSAYDFKFLDQVLPHCNKQQLVHIERSTKKVDLSPITDKLWKGFYARDFGGKALDETIEKMKMNKKVGSLTWSEIYEAKSRSFEKNEKEMGAKMRRMYEKEEARKQSRQVKVVMDKTCSPSNKKLGVNNQKGKTKKSKNSKMEKIKKQFDRSLEKKNLDVYHMKRARQIRQQQNGDRSSVDLLM